MRGDRIVQGVLGLNVLVALAAFAAWAGIEILPGVRPRAALVDIASCLLLGGVLLWSLLSGADDGSVRRLKSWTDLFWNAWSYYGVYSLAKVVVTGRGDLKQVLPHLSACLLVPIIAGVMLNAMVRVVLALTEVINIRRLRAPLGALVFVRDGPVIAAQRPPWDRRLRGETFAREAADERSR